MAEKPMIMAVDHDSILLKKLEATCESSNCDFIGACDGDECLEKLGGNKVPDLNFCLEV